MTGHHDRFEPTSHTYLSQRLQLHYVDWGNPGAPPLLLIHGGGDHCRNWDRIAERLRHDWHVITPDLRGHGDSQWATDGNYDLENYIYDLTRLIAQQGLAPVTLIGHSLGGRIVIRYAGIFPERVRKLVALEGFGPAPQATTRRVNRTLAERMRLWIEDQDDLARRTPRRYASIEDAQRRMQEEYKNLSPEQIRHLTKHSVQRNEDGTYSWKFDNYARIVPPYDMEVAEVEDLWHRIACPALFLNGDRSWSPNAEADGKTAHFQNARAATIAGASHWMHHDQHDAVCDVLIDFLSDGKA